MFVRAVLLLALLLSCSALDGGGKPNLVLITIDTLRADHLGCYGYGLPTSPHLDRLASTGTVFRAAFAPTPITLPSHASMLSGLYPNRHGLRDNAFFPPVAFPMVAELLKKSGYSTAAFVSAAPLKSKYGLSRGFDFYDDEFAGSERPAERTTEHVLRWLEKAKAPYFLWIHYFDPHAEYSPPAAFAKRFPDRPYDGEIAYVDDQLSRVLEALPPQTCTIVTADHGESLGEHGEKTHGVFLYNATLHVPLILAGCGTPALSREDAVTVTDVAPTLLDLAGVDVPEHMDGRSLLKKPEARWIHAESLYAQRNFGYAPLYAVIGKAWKYIHAPDPELYSLQDDPAERKNRHGEAELDLAPWRTRALEYEKEAQPVASLPMDAEEVERLRSLGYVGSMTSFERVDPKSRIRVITDFNDAMGSLYRGKFSEAESAFRRITEVESKSALAFRFLGDSLAAQKNYAAAMKAYSKAYALSPDPETGVKWAKSSFATGNASAAESILLEIGKRYPDSYESVFELASLYGARKQWKEAFALLSREHPEFHHQRGILYLQLNDPDSAASEFEKALRMREKASYWNNLGIARRQQGKIRESEESFRNAFRLDPESGEYAMNLASLLMSEKRWPESEVLLMDVCTRFSDFWKARHALGVVREMQGKIENAATTYRDLLRDAPATWSERGQVEERLRRLSVSLRE